MAQDDSSEGSRNFALQPVNIPPTMEIMFTPSPQNPLDTNLIPVNHFPTQHQSVNWSGKGKCKVCVFRSYGVHNGMTILKKYLISYNVFANREWVRARCCLQSFKMLSETS